MKLANIQCIGCQSVRADFEAEEARSNRNLVRGQHRCPVCRVEMQTFPVTCDKCGARLGWLTFPADRDVAPDHLRGHLCDTDAGILPPTVPPTPPKDKART